MARVVGRQRTTCPADTQWYVCTRGPFRGCCSLDPCTSGICPDENSNELASSPDLETDTATRTRASTTRTATATTTRTTTTTTTTATTTRAAGSSTTTDRDTDVPATSVSSTTSTQTSATPSTTTTETIDAQPTSATDVAAPSQRHSNAAMVGGIVGGVVPLLILLAFIALLLFRMKKKRGRFRLLRWRCPRIEYEQAKLEEGNMASAAQPQAQPSSTPVGRAVTDLPNDQLTISPEEPSQVISPLQAHEINSLQTTSSIPPIISLASRKDPASSLKIDCPTPTIPSHPTAIHLAFHQQTEDLPPAQPTAISFIQKVTTDPPAKINPHKPPQELFDTGFWRGRQELSANSSHELINIPFIERLRQKQQKQLASTAGPSTPIVTQDGAILSANFNNQPVDPESHAMSFMNYDSPAELKPPDSRGEWRRVDGEGEGYGEI
ncbi:hypothetical protein BDV12DRAFT_91455 [Aspergillus spectabilis]